MQYFQEDSQVTKEEAYLYGLGIVLMSAFYTFTHHPYFFGVMHTGSRIRIACCALLYRKVCVSSLSIIMLNSKSIIPNKELMDKNNSVYNFCILMRH